MALGLERGSGLASGLEQEWVWALAWESALASAQVSGLEQVWALVSEWAWALGSVLVLVLVSASVLESEWALGSEQAWAPGWVLELESERAWASALGLVSEWALGSEQASGWVSEPVSARESMLARAAGGRWSRHSRRRSGRDNSPSPQSRPVPTCTPLPRLS